MSVNTDLARAYHDRFPHDPAVVELFAPGFVFHHLREIDRDGFGEFAAGVSRAFPDFAFHLHHVIEDGDLVATHYDFSGTQADTFLGTVPPRGGSFRARGMSLYRCEGGQIAEIWVAFDTLRMMQGLGAVPEIV